jgi:hypothetical protein
MDLFQHELEDAVIVLQAQVATLEARVTALEAAAGGTSEPASVTSVLNQEVSS